MARYNNRRLLNNNLRMYDKMLESRGIKPGSGLRMYETPELTHPSAFDIANLDLVPHRWVLGDKFYKLAHAHYGRPELWWVIAWFNLTPTESHVELGDLLYIPKPLEDILDIYGV
jgi:hypothetical protein